MIYLIGGENIFQSTEALNKLISTFQKKGQEYISIYIDDDNAEQKIAEHCFNVGFFSDHKLVIVKAIDRANADQRGKLEEIIDNVEDLVLWSRSKLDKRSRLYKIIKEKGTVEEYNLPSNKEIETWIQNYCKKIGLNIEKNLVREISFRIGTDPAIIVNELVKLKCLQDDGEKITSDLIKDVITLNEEADIWELMDSMAGRNKYKSLELMMKATKDLEYEYIMGLIVRQLRLLYLASCYRDRARLVELGVHPFVAGKIIQQAQLLNKSKLEKLYQRIVDMEIGVKTGRLDKMLALDLLVIAF